MEALRQSGRIGVDLLCAIHEALMRGTGDAMGLRDEQVWIGGSPPLASSDTTIRHSPEETRVLVEGKSLIMSEYASTASKDKKFFFRAGQTRMGTGFLSAMRLSCLVSCQKHPATHQSQSSANAATSVQDPCDGRKDPACVDTSEQQEPASQPAHLLSASLSAGAQDGFYLRFLRLQCTSECPNAHGSYQKFQQNRETTYLGLPEDTGQSGR